MFLMYPLADKPAASDLVQWVSRLSMELLRQSPSPVLRQCASLAKTFKPLANELFNISFSSMWDALVHMTARLEICNVLGSFPLVESLELAFKSPQIPNKICSTLLNVAEFMEILDKPLPLDTQLLARAAAAVDSFSRCLYYREIEFNSRNVPPSSECIESLITINNKLGNLDAAAGVLEYVKRRYSQVIPQPCQNFELRGSMIVIIYCFLSSLRVFVAFILVCIIVLSVTRDPSLYILNAILFYSLFHISFFFYR